MSRETKWKAYRNFICGGQQQTSSSGRINYSRIEDYKKEKSKGKQILVMIIKILFVILILLLLVVCVIAGAFGGMGPFGFIQKNRIAKKPGNGEEYHLENVETLETSPIQGKNLCFLGSSVTKGEHSLDVSFADYIAKRNSCTYVKEAVSGTTLVDNGKNSYIQRMVRNIDVNEDFDAFICQLSTNDATRKMPMGSIGEGKELENFDTKTIAGAMEYIICYAQKTWDCPVIFYTGTKYDSEQYGQMVELLYQLKEKWGIGIIDLWNNEEMNNVSEEDYELYMSDGIHPTQAGYLKWWTPVMEEYLYSEL